MYKYYSINNSRIISYLFFNNQVKPLSHTIHWNKIKTEWESNTFLKEKKERVGERRKKPENNYNKNNYI